MNLIIDADLVGPPSQLISVRELTFIAHEFLHYDVILETDNNKDFYYNFLKSKIWPLDYIEDIVRCGEENGMRISILPRFSPSIITERITSANVYSLLQSIGMRIARFR